MNEVLIMSRCHESEVEWTPEVTMSLADIPHTIVGNRPIFDKAIYRDVANAVVDLPEPVHEGMNFNIRDPLCRARSGMYHWLHSKCVRTSFMKWTRYTQALVIDGARFAKLEEQDQCPSCRAEFEKS